MEATCASYLFSLQHRWLWHRSAARSRLAVAVAAEVAAAVAVEEAAAVVLVGVAARALVEARVPAAAVALDPVAAPTESGSVSGVPATTLEETRAVSVRMHRVLRYQAARLLPRRGRRFRIRQRPNHRVLRCRVAQVRSRQALQYRVAHRQRPRVNP
jgi:hypothetical protein